MGYLDHVGERFGLIRLAAYLRQALERIVMRAGVRDKEHENSPPVGEDGVARGSVKKDSRKFCALRSKL